MPVLVLLLLACRPECDGTRRWADIPVASAQPGDLGHQLAADDARGALDQLAAWSDLAEVCVHDVWIEDEVRGAYRVEGSYRLPGERVQISPFADDAWGVTTHELCHAVDHTIGLSDDHAELFPDDEVPDIPGYGGPTRTAEAFARICEDGARDHLRWQTAAACGHPMTDDDPAALARIQESIFPWAPRLAWDDPSLQVAVGAPWRATAGPDWRQGEVAADPDHVVVLWKPAPDGRARGARLTWHDWATGTRVATLDLPCTDPEWCPASLVPGDAGPLLRLDGALRVLGPGTLGEPLPCAASGVVVGDQGWRLPGGGGLERCDLSTGRTSSLEVPVPTYALAQQHVGTAVRSLTLAGGHVALSSADAGLSWRRDDGAWIDHALPWHLGVRAQAPLLGTSLQALLLETNDLDGQRLRYLAALDLETGELLAPTDPCPQVVDLHAGALLAGSGWAVVPEQGALLGSAPSFTPYAIGLEGAPLSDP
ncbi:MAG: hypothetical protein H6742_04965 [Alphaproteobacteria bacterium]|nr:hypothetical protein [Alphaproteobacteria bacterium]